MIYQFCNRALGDETLAKANAEKAKEKLPVVIKNIEARVSKEGWILSPEVSYNSAVLSSKNE